jgi:hypothetical protein
MSSASSGLTDVIFFPYKNISKYQPEQVSALIPKWSCYETVKPAAQRAGGPLPQQQSDPTKNEMSFQSFLCKDGLIQNPLETLQQGIRI